MTAAGNIAPGGRKRLDSWKEIAAFFGRDERTVNRWEKDLGLPVHRMPGRAKGPVYAYTDELAAWMATPRQEGAPAAIQGPGEASENAVGPQSGSAVQLGPALVPPQALHLNSRSGWSTAAWLRVGGIATLVCILGWSLLHGPNTSISRSKRATDVSGRHSASGVVQASTPPHNPEAEQLYLQGRYYWTKRTPDDLTKAVDYFTQAIVKDPGYSNAYVGLADCYNLLREYTLMPASEAYPRALSAALKAVELDDQSSEAHASVAFASFWGKWDFVTADREFQRAIELDSSNAVAHHWYATFLAMTGRSSEALTEIDRAQALDPASTSILADKGDLLLLAGRLTESLSLLQKMEATEPKFVSPPRYLKNVYYARGDYPEFLAEWRKEAVLLHDTSMLAMVTAAEKGFAAGGVRGMLTATGRAQEKMYAKHLVSPYDLARTYAELNDRPTMFRYLNLAYGRHDTGLIAVKVDKAFDGVRDDAAYRDLTARMGFQEN